MRLLRYAQHQKCPRLVLRLEVNLVTAAGKVTIEALVEVKQLRSTAVNPIAG